MEQGPTIMTGAGQNNEQDVDMEQGQAQEQGLGWWLRLDDQKIAFQHVQSGFCPWGLS